MFTCFFSNKNKSMYHIAAQHMKEYKMEASLQISKNQCQAMGEYPKFKPVNKP